MKSISIKWYVALFAGVMGIAAGSATELQGGYIDAAITAMGQAEGIRILTLSLIDILLNGALFCWCRILSGKVGQVMAVMALLCKSMLMGLFGRELITTGLSGIKALMIALTAFGGGCVCASMIMAGEDRQAKGRRFAVWLSGVATEGIIIPSIVRTWALLFN